MFWTLILRHFDQASFPLEYMGVVATIFIYSSGSPCLVVFLVKSYDISLEFHFSSELISVHPRPNLETVTWLEFYWLSGKVPMGIMLA